jgi:hypothetical protein
MGIAGYVSVCVQLYCVGFHCLSLHVSAYMAIFRCVGYSIFMCLKDSASLLFLYLFSRGHTLHVFICVFFFLFSFFTLLFPRVLFLCSLNIEQRAREKNVEKSSEVESFKHMKIEYPTHLKMAM